MMGIDLGKNLFDQSRGHNGTLVGAGHFGYRSWKDAPHGRADFWELQKTAIGENVGWLVDVQTEVVVTDFVPKRREIHLRHVPECPPWIFNEKVCGVYFLDQPQGFFKKLDGTPGCFGFGEIVVTPMIVRYLIPMVDQIQNGILGAWHRCPNDRCLVPTWYLIQGNFGDVGRQIRLELVFDVDGENLVPKVSLSDTGHCFRPCEKLDEIAIFQVGFVM